MANGTDEKKTPKEKAKDLLSDHLWKIILGAVFLFLLNHWLGSFGDRVGKLEAAITTATTVQTGLGFSLDSLRWQIDDIDEDAIKMLTDHEARLRELEKK